jgi:hypothetical protein
LRRVLQLSSISSAVFFPLNTLTHYLLFHFIPFLFL